MNKPVSTARVPSVSDLAKAWRKWPDAEARRATYLAEREAAYQRLVAVYAHWNLPAPTRGALDGEPEAQTGWWT